MAGDCVTAVTGWSSCQQLPSCIFNSSKRPNFKSRHTMKPNLGKGAEFKRKKNRFAFSLVCVHAGKFLASLPKHSPPIVLFKPHVSHKPSTCWPNFLCGSLLHSALFRSNIFFALASAWFRPLSSSRSRLCLICFFFRCQIFLSARYALGNLKQRSQVPHSVSSLSHVKFFVRPRKYLEAVNFVVANNTILIPIYFAVALPVALLLLVFVFLN